MDLLKKKKEGLIEAHAESGKKRFSEGNKKKKWGGTLHYNTTERKKGTNNTKNWGGSMIKKPMKVNEEEVI